MPSTAVTAHTPGQEDRRFRTRRPRGLARPCPRCGSTATKRNGHAAGRQLYFCHGCRRSFSERTGQPRPASRLPEARARFEALMAEQVLPLREVARRIGIGLATAWRWRQQWLRRLSEAEREVRPLGPLVGLHHLSLPRSRTWRAPFRLTQPSLRAAAEPREGRLAAPAAVLLPARALVFGVALTALGQPLGAACRLVPAHAHARLTLAEGVARLMDRHGRVVTSVGAAEVSLESGRPRLDWYRPPFPCLPDALAREAAVELRKRFCQWMARFRGVALAYLDGYVAWFNQLLAAGQQVPPWLTPGLVPAWLGL